MWAHHLQKCGASIVANLWYPPSPTVVFSRRQRWIHCRQLWIHRRQLWIHQKRSELLDSDRRQLWIHRLPSFCELSPDCCCSRVVKLGTSKFAWAFRTRQLQGLQMAKSSKPNYLQYSDLILSMMNRIKCKKTAEPIIDGISSIRYSVCKSVKLFFKTLTNYKGDLEVNFKNNLIDIIPNWKVQSQMAADIWLNLLIIYY